MKRARTTAAALPESVQKLLRLPGNEAARAAVEKVSPMAVQSGPDADVVTKREHESASRRRASKSGKRSEMLVIDAYHKAAFASGVARMEKVATPTTRIGPAPYSEKPGAFTAIYAGKPWVDCHGYTLRGATAAILEEVKGCNDIAKSGEYEPFDLSRIQPHQRDTLVSAHAAGHIAVVTLVFGEGLAARVYVVPWSWFGARRTVHEREVRGAGFLVTPATYLHAQVIRGAR